MATQKKQFKNYEKEINLLIEELSKEKIIREKTRISLLQKMYEKHFYNLSDVDKYKWAESEKANFTKMVKGDGRTFTVDHIIAIEKVGGKSFAEIISPENAKAQKAFSPHSIRYAAYCDSLELYEQLFNEEDADGRSPLLNFDEFGKSIIDYMLIFQSKAGLRFLIENSILTYSHGGLYSNIYNLDEKEQDVWNMIFKLDDKELFEKLFQENSLLYVPDSSPLLEKILNTDNILSYLLEPKMKKNFKENVSCMVTILPALLDLAISKNSMAKAEKIASAYKAYVDTQIKKAEKRIDKSLINSFYAETVGELTYICLSNKNDVTNLFTTLTFKKIKEPKEIACILEACSLNNILKKLNRKAPAELAEGESSIDADKRVMYVRPKKSDTQFFAYVKLLKYMQSKGFTGLPHIYEEKNGVFTMDIAPSYKRRFSDICEGNALAPAMKLLSEFHRLCEEKLGKGKAYLFKEEMGYNIAPKYKSSTLHFYSIPDEIGNPVVDMVSLILETTSIRDINRNNIKLLKEIQEALSSYYSKETVKGFGSKFIKEIDKRLSKAHKGRCHDYISDYEKLYFAKAFVDMYKDELDNIKGENHPS